MQQTNDDREDIIFLLKSVAEVCRALAQDIASRGVADNIPGNETASMSLSYCNGASNSLLEDVSKSLSRIAIQLEPLRDLGSEQAKLTKAQEELVSGLEAALAPLQMSDIGVSMQAKA